MLENIFKANLPRRRSKLSICNCRYPAEDEQSTKAILRNTKCTYIVPVSTHKCRVIYSSKKHISLGGLQLIISSNGLYIFATFWVVVRLSNTVEMEMRGKAGISCRLQVNQGKCHPSARILRILTSLLNVMFMRYICYISLFKLTTRFKIYVK